MLMIALPPAQLSEHYAWKAPNPSRAVLQHLCTTRECSPGCAMGSPPATQGAWSGTSTWLQDMGPLASSHSKTDPGCSQGAGTMQAWDQHPPRPGGSPRKCSSINWNPSVCWQVLQHEGDADVELGSVPRLDGRLEQGLLVGTGVVQLSSWKPQPCRAPSECHRRGSLILKPFFAWT